jgi:hypothetical protein
MKIDDLEEFISFVRSTGATPETSLFTHDELLKIEEVAYGGSDRKVEKHIRKMWKKKNEKK